MEKLIDRIKKTRLALQAERTGSSWADYFSAETLAESRAARAALERFAKGRLLDAGAGHRPYASLLGMRVSEYHTLDIEARGAAPTYIADVQAMPQVPGGAYDTVLCLEVLEHVAEPAKALAELHRVLAAGGVLIISVPHLSRIHEAPRDYFRYTEYGLRFLLEQAGFQIDSLEPRGGLFCFVGHQLSTVFWGILGRARWIRPVIAFFNRIFLVFPFLWLDHLFNPDGIFASGYLAVARKPPQIIS